MAGLDGSEPPTKTARFCVPSEKEIEELIVNKDSSRTKNVIRCAEAVFTSFCQEADTTVTDVQNSPCELSSLLRLSMQELDRVMLSCIRRNQL